MIKKILKKVILYIVATILFIVAVKIFIFAVKIFHAPGRHGGHFVEFLGLTFISITILCVITDILTLYQKIICLTTGALIVAGCFLKNFGKAFATVEPEFSPIVYECTRHIIWPLLITGGIFIYFPLLIMLFKKEKLRSGRKILHIAILSFVVLVIIIKPQFLFITQLAVHEMPLLLESGDKTIVNKKAYLHSTPRRGDIVLLKNILDRGSAKNYPRKWRNLVKYGRGWFHIIIGLPEDNILIKNGEIYINGNPAQISQLPAYFSKYEREKMYRTSNQRYGYGGKEVAITVPSGHYFAINVEDIFYPLEPVTLNDITGKVIMVYYPFERFKLF